MGALPKKKPSTQRQGRRRATQKINLPKVVKCKNCGADKRPHYLCQNCNQ